MRESGRNKKAVAVAAEAALDCSYRYSRELVEEQKEKAHGMNDGPNVKPTKLK